MRTPITEMLATIAPKLVSIVSEAALHDQENLEVKLQDAMNAQFGDTKQSVEALQNIRDALEEVADI
jgi:lactam utilization protein B